MSHSAESSREHPSAYPIQDFSNQTEMTRLEIQDQLVTSMMGGVLPELADPGTLQRVLDVGCATGDWLIETAKTYPTIKTLVGGEISHMMVEYARTKAENLGLGGRVQFQTMDALRVLEFPPSYFDLINQRGGVSWLRTWEWKKILLEYQRVARPGAIIRITEGDIVIESNSPALTKLFDLILVTFRHSGRLFTASSDGVISELEHLMAQHGIENIQTQSYALVHRAGTFEGEHLYENMRRLFREILPFLDKWTRIPPDYEEIYQQALQEMRQPDFIATMKLLTAWGNKPQNGRTLLIRGGR